MSGGEDHKRQKQEQTKREMRQEHRLVEIVLVGEAAGELQESDRAEICGVGSQDRYEREHDIQNEAQARAYGADIFFLRRSSRILGHIGQYGLA